MNQMLAQYKKLLSQFVSFKSISTDKTFQPEIEKTVRWLTKLLIKSHFKVKVIKGYGNPIVLATYVVDPRAETCLIYGHYDVQPAIKSEGWGSEPFKLAERQGKLYARGVVDNKGQILTHIIVLSQLIQQRSLGYNITLVIEGNEETGSEGIFEFVKKYKQALTSNFVLISDGEIVGVYPTIELGFRGTFNLTLTVRTSKTDLHSGIYGGAVPNAAQELSKFLALLYDRSNRIAIPRFYNGVDSITAEMLKNARSPAFDPRRFQKIAGVKKLLTEPKLEVYTQVGLRPTIQITGLKSGYIGEGYRNSIPSLASAKINVRLVKQQKPKQVIAAIRNFAKKKLPSYVDFSIETTGADEGVKLDTHNNYVQRAVKLLEAVYKQKAIKKYVGGTIPIVTLFAKELKVPQVLVPLANEDCGMHAPNENFRLANIYKGLTFSQLFFSK